MMTIQKNYENLCIMIKNLNMIYDIVENQQKRTRDYIYTNKMPQDR